MVFRALAFHLAGIDHVHGAVVRGDEIGICLCAVEHEHGLAGEVAARARDAIALAAADLFGDAHSDDDFAGGNARQPAFLLFAGAGGGDGGRCHDRRGNVGHRSCGCAEGLGDERGFEVPKANTAVVLVDKDAVDAEASQFLPHIVGPGAAVLGDLAHAFQG